MNNTVKFKKGSLNLINPTLCISKLFRAILTIDFKNQLLLAETL